MPTRGTASVFELAVLLLCAALVVVPLPQNIQDVIILTFLWAGVALAWNIAGGYAGLISFGHAAFFGIGAYTSTILGVKAEITPWIGIWLGGLLAAACGCLLAVICARLRGPFFILSTLAAAEVVRIGALNWATLTGGPEGLAILPVAEREQHGVRLQEHLCGADARLPGPRLCRRQVHRRLALRLSPVRRPRRRGRCQRVGNQSAH